MHQDFEKYRPTPGEDAKQLNVRIPTELHERIKILSQLEGDTIVGLVVEGLARVVEDRILNPLNSPEALARMAERRADILAELGVIDSMMPPVAQ